MKKESIERRYVPRAKYDIEVNAKNTAYGFILSCGLFKQFSQYWQKQQAIAQRDFIAVFERAMKNEVPISDMVVMTAANEAQNVVDNITDVDTSDTEN